MSQAGFQTGPTCREAGSSSEKEVLLSSPNRDNDNGADLYGTR